MMWKEDLRIGVEKIDSQHKTLCDAIDNLFEACKNGKGRDEVLKTISFLEDYTVKHFRDEELIQKQSGYIRCAEHKAIHDAFIKKVGEMKTEIEQKGVDIATVGKINSLIVDWLYNHIRKVDKEIAEYVNK